MRLDLGSNKFWVIFYLFRAKISYLKASYQFPQTIVSLRFSGFSVNVVGIIAIFGLELRNCGIPQFIETLESWLESLNKPRTHNLHFIITHQNAC